MSLRRHDRPYEMSISELSQADWFATPLRSVAQFDASNYGTNTTSEVEYWFVVNPVEGLSKTARDVWPTEEKLRADPARR